MLSWWNFKLVEWPELIACVFFEEVDQLLWNDKPLFFNKIGNRGFSKLLEFLQDGIQFRQKLLLIVHNLKPSFTTFIQHESRFNTLKTPSVPNKFIINFLRRWHQTYKLYIRVLIMSIFLWNYIPKYNSIVTFIHQY